MKKLDVFLIGAGSFFAGVALGFLLSPAKNGFGNNSGNTTHYHYGTERNNDSDDSDECCCCCGEETPEDSAVLDSDVPIF